jgi:SAM-dependent methyltransferase
MNPQTDTSASAPSPTDTKAEEARPVASLVLPLNTPPIRIDTEVDAAGLAKLLAHTEQTWTRLGQLEPHWSVISAERFRQAELDENRAEFYASGQGDVDTFLAFLARNEVDTAGFQKALEYGCGVGRVTRFLAQRFSEVVACDISPSHLAQADQYLKDCALDNVTFVRICSLADLSGPADLDVVFCVIVLQHNPPPAIVAILQGLLARLRPGGVAYFQVPTHAADYSFNVDDYLAHGLEAGHIEMHYVPQRRIFQIARDSACDVLEVREDDWVGRRHVELSNTFLLRKR